MNPEKASTYTGNVAGIVVGVTGAIIIVVVVVVVLYRR